MKERQSLNQKIQKISNNITQEKMNFDNMDLYNYIIITKEGKPLQYNNTTETIIFSTKLEAIQNAESGERVVKQTK